MNIKKSIFFSLVLFLLGINSLSAQSLVAGDIAFIGYNTDTRSTNVIVDDFTWIALTDIPAGEVIYFSDQGWNSGWQANSEVHISWTAPAGGLSCGTVVHIYESTANTMNVSGGGTVSGILAGLSWNLSGGDQVIAYQSSTGAQPASPTFISGVHGDDGNGTPTCLDLVTFWNQASCTGTSVARSTVPTGLTNGIDCVSLFPSIGTEQDNAKYTGTLTGTSTTLRALINDNSNWTFNDATAFDISPAQYSPSVTCVAPCSDPDVPTLSASPSSICPGASSTLSISGNLNDATQWHVYTGSCGGTQIGTTASSSFVVSPASTTTYYIRGEGGCVTPGSCGTVTVTVGDAINPTITCPGNQTGNVDASCNFSLPDYTSLATASDNCTASPTITQSPAPGTNVGVGTTIVTLTATDGSSNTANCNFNVVVSDVTNPTITCPGNQTGNVDVSCNFSLPDYTSLATANDNCPGVTVTQSPAPGTNVGVGTTNIVLTATDASSNTSNCNFNVVVSDATNPTISCPGNQVGNVDGSCNFSLPDYTGLATANDNCPGVTVTQSPAPGTNVGVGTTNIVLTATDASSNTSNCNFNVVVSDAINPTITCPGNQVGSVGASCVFSLPDYTGLATPVDNCPGVTVTQVPAPGTNVGVGTTNIVLTATDASSNTANCNFDVVVSDNTNPTITCPGNQTENPNASCQFVLPDYTGLATATDNCTASPTVTQSPAAGTTITGNTTITLTATDGSSNTAQCTFDVILNDATNPTAVCQNISVYLDGTGNTTIVAGDIDGGSTDNCSGVTLGASQTAFTCADLGANNVTLTVTDGNSNTDNCLAVVTVMDTISPMITCPGNQTGTPTVACQYSLPDYTGLAMASDNCASTPSITQSPVSGTMLALGNHTVTLTADDGNGNTSQCSFTVSVSSNNTGSQTLTECDGFSITVGSNTYTTTGVYTDTLVGAAANGCDSIHTTNLTINTVDVSTTTNNDTITSNATTATYQWLDCDNNYAIITGETNQQYIVTATGNYAVEVTQNGCIDTSACENIVITGIDINDPSKVVVIYPNPTTGLITLDFSQMNGFVNYNITTIDGRVIKSGFNVGSDKVNVDLSDESKGVYLIKIEHNSSVDVLKLIKQ